MEKFADSLGTQINIVARSLRLYLEKELSHFGVSPSQWMLFMALGEKDHQVQTDLARMVHLDNATVTRIIDKLEKKKLVARKQDIEDRRAQIVSLTPLGKTTWRKWNSIGEKVNQSAKDGVDAGDLAAFFRVMNTIGDNLNGKINHK